VRARRDSALENASLMDNWDDAEGYYSKLLTLYLTTNPCIHLVSKRSLLLSLCVQNTVFKTFSIRMGSKSVTKL